jgi:mannitol/fructose-specific phosphotransferase system IIA component (Ntr-type)
LAAVDGKPERMVILITMRDSSTGQDHMRVFSTLARKLIDEGFRNQMLAIDDSHKMVWFLNEQFDAPVDPI